MRLVIQNVARVESATIDLGGIAVLAGANGTGKSTISRSLMSISSVTRRINSLILVERGRSIVTALQESFKKYGGDIFYAPTSSNGNLGGWLQCLNVEWWKDESRVISWLKEHNREDVIVFPQEFLDRPQCAMAVKEAKPKILDAIDRADDVYVTYICKKLFKKAFNGQLKPVFVNQVKSYIAIEDVDHPDANVSITFNDGEVNAYTNIGRTFYPSVVYFEPLHYVDFVNDLDKPVSDRYSAGSHCSCFVIKKDLPKNLSLEEQSELDDANEIIKDIISNIHGRLVNDDADIKFNESFSDGNHLINVKNIASGMKTMAAIVRAVENRSIRKGSLLIVDEPESNLHPHWQVSFAAFLAAFAKRLSVSLLLNTHSPYFMQAIRVFARESNVPCRFYDMVCHDDAFYAEDVSDRLERIFRTMSEPFNNLICA